MTNEREPFPPPLAEIGRLLYGDRWMTDLARDLGVTARQMRNYANGTSALPLRRWRAIAELIDARGAALRKKANRLILDVISAGG